MATQNEIDKFVNLARDVLEAIAGVEAIAKYGKGLIDTCTKLINKIQASNGTIEDVGLESDEGETAVAELVEAGAELEAVAAPIEIL